MSGLEVIRNAKERFLEQNISMPSVLMMTGIEDPRLREVCFRENSVDYFMIKPVPVDQFEQVIRNIISQWSNNL